MTPETFALIARWLRRNPNRPIGRIRADGIHVGDLTVCRVIEALKRGSKSMTVTKVPYFTDIEDVKAFDRVQGGKFFSPGNMRFANSRAHARVYAGRYFVTSERDQYACPSRRYTIREIDPETGYIRTAGEHGQYATSGGAHAAAQRLAETGYPHVCPYCRHRFATEAERDACDSADRADAVERERQYQRWHERVNRRSGRQSAIYEPVVPPTA